ncbi:DUF4386 domain-containing protein, partial [Flavihumibacter sp. CACIAM 22H1]|uniref:DUF4386 domain-containing protein n=1 Tax=Flavihumibacter sp. CACIAM 22H1 TaxID=1812911 RepID=UPI0007A8AC92
MNTTKKKAGVAGLIYLAVIITGLFSLAYVPNKLIDWNNSSITFNNIKNAQSFFRIGIYSSVLCYLFFSFLPLALYNLLKTVNETQARTMVLLALLSVPLSFNNLQHSYTALLLTGNDQMIKGTEVDALATKLMFSLHQYNEGILLITVFWGLWLFP